VTMRIRPATREDAAALAQLHVASRRAAMPWLAEVHTVEETTAYVADELLAHATVLVADDGARIVGYIAVAGGELDHLYLAPDVLRRGIGSRLLAEAKTRSPGGLALWAFQRNVAARAFYEAHGFVVDHMTDGSGNEEREPDVRYRWSR